MTNSATADTPARRSHGLVKKGIAALRIGAPEKAIPFLENSLGEQKSNPDGYYYLALALAGISSFSAARDSLSLARQRMPSFFDGDGRFGLYPEIDFTGGKIMVPDWDNPVVQSHKQMEDGIDLLDRGQASLAVEFLLSALEINSWNIAAYYYLAQAFAHSDEAEKARSVFEKAIKDFPYAYQRASRFGEFQGFGLDAKTTKAYYAALASVYPDINTFIETCPRTGLSATSLDPASEDLLLNLYQNRLNDWDKNQLTKPVLAGPSITQFEAGGKSGKSVLYVSPRHIKCNPAWVEYDATFHYLGTGKLAFSEFEIHYADKFHSEGNQLAAPRSDAELSDGIAALADHIGRIKPDIVFFDGNFLGGQQGICAEHFKDMKQKFNFKLATWVGDIYPPKPNFSEYWSEVSDVIVAMNNHPYLEAARKNCAVLSWPGVTIDQQLMNSIEANDRDIGVLYIGSRKGYRDLGCAFLADAELPLHRKFTDQSTANSVGKEEYIELLKRARLVFNSGLVSSRDHHPNFRMFETLCSGAVLLQHDFELMRSYFTPYVHYAPYTNAHEMVSTAQFLLKHDEIADEIASRGFAWYRDHYAGPSFWREVERALWPAPNK